MVNVPIIAASRFESDVENGDGIPIMRQLVEIGFPGEILGVGFVKLAKAKETTIRSGAYLLIANGLAFYYAISDDHTSIGVGSNPTVVKIHILGHAESSPRIGPTGVKRQLGEDFHHFFPGNAVFPGGS